MPQGPTAPPNRPGQARGLSLHVALPRLALAGFPYSVLSRSSGVLTGDWQAKF